MNIAQYKEQTFYYSPLKLRFVKPVLIFINKYLLTCSTLQLKSLISNN